MAKKTAAKTKAPTTKAGKARTAPVRAKRRRSKGDISARLIGPENQPVSAVEWVHRDMLKANDYNPNHVAPPELELLRISILEDGWTQPIVIREDNEIVDGFHRWTISGEKQVGEMTGYMVPVVRLVKVDGVHQRMSTIRHNRARGVHGVTRMSEIVLSLHRDDGLSVDEIAMRLQMENEEIQRMLDAGDMLKRGSRDDFEHAWVPTRDGQTKPQIDIGKQEEGRF